MYPVRVSERNILLYTSRYIGLSSNPSILAKRGSHYKLYPQLERPYNLGRSTTNLLKIKYTWDTTTMGKDNRFGPEGAPRDKDYRKGSETLQEQLEQLGGAQEIPPVRKSQGTFMPHQDHINERVGLPRQPDRPRRVDGEIRTPKPQVNLTPEEQVALHLGKKLIESKIFSPKDAMRMLDALSKNTSKGERAKTEVAKIPTPIVVSEPQVEHEKPVVAPLEERVPTVPENSPIAPEKMGLIPEFFKAGQRFVLPEDHTSDEATWEVTVLMPKEGAMMMKQIDRLRDEQKEKGRAERFEFREFKQFLENLYLERQRAAMKTAPKKPVVEALKTPMASGANGKSSVLRPAASPARIEKKTSDRTTKDMQGFRRDEVRSQFEEVFARDQKAFISLYTTASGADNVMQYTENETLTKHPYRDVIRNILFAHNIGVTRLPVPVTPPETEQFSRAAIPTTLTQKQQASKDTSKNTSPSAITQKESFGNSYFTPGHIVTISTQSGNESYRIRNTKDGLVEVASIDRREKGVEFFNEEELKKKLASNKKEGAPSHLPIKDLFTMFSQKTNYGVGGLLAWKKKWIDSGEIDLYREKNTNLSISQDQIDAAKKAIDVDIATLQNETVTGEVRRSAITNIGLSVRLLTGVHHPRANDIEHFVKSYTVAPSTGNILQRPKTTNQSPPEELVAPTAVPKEVSPEQEKVPSEKEISLAKKLKIVNPPFDTRIARLKQNKLFGVPMWKYLGTATLVSAAFYTAYTSPKKEGGDISLATSSTPDSRREAKEEWHKYFHLGKTNSFYQEFPKELSRYSTEELSKKLIQKYAPSYVQYSGELSKISSALEMIGKDVQSQNAQGLYDKPLDRGGKELNLLWTALNDASMTTSGEYVRAKTFGQAIKEVKDKVTKKEK